MCFEGGFVSPGYIALVLGETIFWELAIQGNHDPISGDLGDDRGGGDRCAYLVSLPNCQPWDSNTCDRETVGKNVLRSGI